MSKDKERASDDRLALAAVIVGGTVAFLTRRDPMGLGTGLTLGVAGVLLALRGDRAISGRGWLRAALGVVILAVLARVGLELYQEWIVGQWFAEGATNRGTSGELKRMTELAAALRITALSASLAMLLGAIVGRMK